MSGKNLVVIKLGALGDVVRTSYLVTSYAKANGFEGILWITKPNAFDLLKGIPNVTAIGSEDVSSMTAFVVLSLDDEFDSVRLLNKISYKKLIGAYLDEFGIIRYTSDSAAWFDMGLVSKYGKGKADELKRSNERSHVEIFSQILGLKDVQPFFIGDKGLEIEWKSRRSQFDFVVGFNIFAGSRWPSKELPSDELHKLLSEVKRYLCMSFINPGIVIFSDESNDHRAIELAKNNSDIVTWRTGKNVLEFAAAVKACNYVISTDSLGLHLAIAQKVPNLSYYAPTSAVEIDTFGTGVKVISTSPDYCSYRPDADNSSLTSDRIFRELVSEINKLGLVNA